MDWPAPGDLEIGNRRLEFMSTVNRRRATGLAAWLAATFLGVVSILAMPDLRGRVGSHDSFRYLAGAESILSAGQYRMLSGEVDLHYPPGTSLVYAASARLADRAPEEVSRQVNVVAFLLLSVVLFGLLSSLPLPTFGVPVVLFCILTNTFLTSTFGQLWSEPLFLAPFCGLILAIERALRPGDSGSLLPFVAAAFLFGACYVLRYAALSVLPLLAGAALLLLVRRRVGPAGLVLAAFAALSPVVVAWHLAGIEGLGPSPRRLGARLPLEELGPRLEDGWASFLNQLVPIPEGNRTVMLVATLALVVVPVVATLVGFRRLRGHVRRNGDSEAAAEELGVLLSANAVFTTTLFAHVAFLGVVQLVSDRSTNFNLRLMLPAFPWLVASVVTTVGILWGGRLATGPLGIRVSRTSVALLSVALLAGTARSVRSSVLRLVSPTRIESPSSSQGLVAEIRMAAREGRVEKSDLLYSNAQGLAWYALRMNVRKLSELGADESGEHFVLSVLNSPKAEEPAPSLEPPLSSEGVRIAYRSERLVLLRRAESEVHSPTERSSSSNGTR